MATEKDTSEFDTVPSIRKTVDTMQTVENVRARDRALIDVLANGERPYTPEEVEKYQIKYNINWGELNKLIRDANRQVNGALLFKPTLFNATSRGGDVEKRDEYGQKFTTQINELLTRGESGNTHTYLLRSRNASVCLHGIGALMWGNDYAPLPKFVPLENLLIPTDTAMDFSNLSYFDVKVELTPYELFEMTHGETVDENWNIKQVEAILDGLKDLQGINPNNYDWQQNPEKMQELFKQNRCFLNSDAVPKVKLDYFFTKEKETGKWFRKIFLREGIGEAESDNFVYESKEPFANNINRILHVQYGDNSVVAPLKYHSVRGLGQSLYSPAEALNRFRSGLFQHGEEQLRMYFYVQAPADKARQNVIELFQYGIIEDGIKIVPEQERHQVDANLIESIMSQCRQNLSENSSSFVQDINDGTRKEMTLGEAQIRQQSVNIAVSSMLQMMYHVETFYYEEVVRRFLRENSGDKAVEEFQKSLIAAGVPKDLLKAKNWRIEPERVLGAGDQSLALQEAGALMQAKAQFDPKSQRMILRTFTSTVTRDPAKGQLLVPDAPDNYSNGARAADVAFGKLMWGLPVEIMQGIEQDDYIAQMLKNMGGIIQQIIQTDKVGNLQQILGLTAVGQDVQKHIQIISNDPSQAQKVKIYGDAEGKLSNEVKGFAQRLQASGQQSGKPDLKEFINVAFKDLNADTKNAVLQMMGLPPSQMQEIDPKVLKAQQAMQLKAQQFTQKQNQLAVAFEIEQIRKLTEHQNDLSIEKQRANQDLVHTHASKLQELILASQQPDSAAGELGD